MTLGGNSPGKVQPPPHLQPQAVVAKDDEGEEGAGKSGDVAADDGVSDGAALADDPHKEGGGYTPGHPVGPVEDGPVLDKAGGAVAAGAQRIRPGNHADEVLHQIAHGGDAGFQDILGLAAPQEEVSQQGEEEPGADDRHFHNGVVADDDIGGVDQRHQHQQGDGEKRRGRKAENIPQHRAKERGGQREGGGRPRQQGKDGDKVDGRWVHPPCPPAGRGSPR